MPAILLDRIAAGPARGPPEPAGEGGRCDGDGHRKRVDGRGGGARGAEEPTFTVDELAARAGVTVRTIRFYGTRGLLPPPVIGPRRVGHYGQDHLSRLALIEVCSTRA